MSITLQKISGAILFALILVLGLNLGVNGLLPQRQARPTPEVAAQEGGFDVKALAPTPGPASGAAAPAEDDKPLGVRLAAASAERGQAVAKKCQSCHTFDRGGSAKVGPNLFAVVGRPKASFPNFAYSDGLKGLGGSWSDQDLDRFLTKPAAFAPGTKMTFAGLPGGMERADVIAYLRSISPAAPPPPQ
jgi:cytochrome c